MGNMYIAFMFDYPTFILFFMFYFISVPRLFLRAAHKNAVKMPYLRCPVF
jgi:hypothetical protein